MTSSPLQNFAVGGSSKPNLRQSEREALRAMIEEAVPLTPDGKPIPSQGNQSVWRIIVYDDVGRDIIAPLMKVVDLRELGVTLYLHINAPRDVVQGAPVVYFCEPTEENVNKICQDCDACLYEWFYLNFTAELPIALLQSLGEQLSRTALPDLYHIRVSDRYLNYVALSDDFFSLMLSHCFLTLNSQSDEEIEKHVSDIVRGVSHVLLTMQMLPVIVHSKTGAAEEISRRLAVRLSDALEERLLVPSPHLLYGRSLLLIVDRSHDIASALHHPFTYRGLLSDAAGMKLNVARVSLSNGKEQQLEIDPERDPFYCLNAGLSFGDFTEKLEEARKEVKAEQDLLAASGGIHSDLGAEDADDSAAMTELAANAPLIAERKRVINEHTKTAYGLLELIRKRKLDVFNGVERHLLQHGELDREQFQQLLTNCGTVEDRQRLYLIAYLMCKEEEDNAAFVDEQLSLLGSDAKFPALDYFKHLQNWSLHSSSSPSDTRQGSGGGSTAEGFGWSVAQLIMQNVAATLGGTVEKELPLTKMISALLQDSTAPKVGFSSPTSTPSQSVRSQVLQSLSAYDVRAKKAVDLNTVSFSQAVVFSLGGGSVAEYDDLKRWEAAHPRKQVMYGCTGVSTGESLLAQLSKLGEQMSASSNSKAR